MDATRLLPSATAYATPWVAVASAWWGGWAFGARVALASVVMAAVGVLGAQAARRFVMAAQAGQATVARTALMGRTSLVAGSALGLVLLVGPAATGFGVASLALASLVVAAVGALQTLPGRADVRAMEPAC